MRHRGLTTTIALAGVLVLSAVAMTGCDVLRTIPGGEQLVAALGGSRPASGSAEATGSTGSSADDFTLSGQTGGSTGTSETETGGATGGGDAIEVSHGRIYTPAKGTTLRKKLMDRARAALSTSQQFLVHQLWVQGDVAVGDIQPASGGKRHFVAWAPPDYKVVYYAPCKSPRANTTSFGSNVPQASRQLLAKLDFKYVPGPDIAEMKSLARSKTAAWYNGLIKESSAPKCRAVTSTAKMFKDGDGVWWAAVGVWSKPSYLEGTTVVWRWSGGTWRKFATEGSDGMYPALPSTVERGLGVGF